MASDDPLLRSGVVRAVRDGRALVGVTGEGCGSCGKQSGCAIGKMAAGRGETRIELPAPPSLRVGDTVGLEIAGERLVGAALLGYLLPAICLLFGAGVGEAWSGNAGAVSGAFAGLVAGFVAARQLHKRRGDDENLRIRIR